METYKIRIVEILEKDVDIEAENNDAAIDKAKEMYKKEEIILDESDFIGEADFHNVCPHCNVKLESKMIDVDGTNLEEHNVCPDCGYGSPALR